MNPEVHIGSDLPDISPAVKILCAQRTPNIVLYYAVSLNVFLSSLIKLRLVFRIYFFSIDISLHNTTGSSSNSFNSKTG